MEETRGRSYQRKPHNKSQIENYGLSIDETDPENNDLYHRDQYIPEDFPSMKIPEGYREDREDNLPEFINRISKSTLVSVHGYYFFMINFGLLYLQSEFVRKYTDGWTFLFYEDEYIGAFSSVNKADRYASKFSKFSKAYIWKFLGNIKKLLMN